MQIFAECFCDEEGSISIGCDDIGDCPCKPRVKGKKCNECEDGFDPFPDCNTCKNEYYDYPDCKRKIYYFPPKYKIQKSCFIS